MVAFIQLVVSIALLAVGVVIAMNGYDGAKLMQNIYRSNKSSLSGITDRGFSQIVGIAAQIETVTSKYTNEEVIAYHSEVDKKSDDSAVSTELDEEYDYAVFNLNDGTDTVRVDPSYSNLILDEEPIASSNEKVGAMSDNNGVGRDSISATEGKIRDGDTVYVYGEFNIGETEEGNKLISSKEGRPYIITTLSKKNLLKTKFMYSFAYIVFGIIVKVVAVLMAFNALSII